MICCVQIECCVVLIYVVFEKGVLGGLGGAEKQ